MVQVPCNYQPENDNDYRTKVGVHDSVAFLKETNILLVAL
jgi:hypothetical protein